jgi:hypothetical protein
LNRECPKLVAASERITRRQDQEAHLNNVDQLRARIRAWADEFSIPAPLWHLWSNSLSLSKIGSVVPISDDQADGFDEERQQIIRILTSDLEAEKRESKPLISHEFALMSQLADLRLYAIRLYVHLPTDDSDVDLRNSIKTRIHADLQHFPFVS